jgi:hypothetical protein
MSLLCAWSEWSSIWDRGNEIVLTGRACRTHRRGDKCSIDGMVTDSGKKYLPSITLFMNPVPASYPVGTRGPLPRVKRPGREADHSSPSVAEVRNAWSSTSFPHMPSWRGYLYLHIFAYSSLKQDTTSSSLVHFIVTNWCVIESEVSTPLIP